MIDGMPWPAQLGVAGGGWALSFLLLLNFANGRWFVSRREADIHIDRAQRQEALAEKLVASVADMTAVGHFQKAAIDAALERAEAEAANHHGEGDG